MVEVVVFAIAAAIVLSGAVGVIAFSNPVHSALSLVATLFGIAVLFVAQDAHFLAAVQVIVYAGAIVVLFLFVIMLLGVDQSDDLSTEPIGGQRPLAAAAAMGILGIGLVTLFLTDRGVDTIVTGDRSVIGPLSDSENGPIVENVNKLGEALFTDYIFAFELTSVLLLIAVVGAVVLARTERRTRAEAEADDTGVSG
jgi:NADH-quinone oxidoreductase subunit J